MNGVILLQLKPSGNLKDTAQLLCGAGFRLLSAPEVPLDRHILEAALRRASAQPEVRLILTVGGACFSPSDQAPEALCSVCTRTVPGIPERIRASLPPAQAGIFRGQAGLCGGVLCVNLPEFSTDAALRAMLPAARVASV